ncbi:MAG: diguanylate cyclase [Candidatus Nanoarchaeia archaeon]
MNKIDVLKKLASLSEKQQALLKDEFHRLTSLHHIEDIVFSILSGMRDLISMEQRFMTTKHLEEMNRLEKDKEAMRDAINEQVDTTVKAIKVAFHNILDEEDIEDIHREIAKQKERLKELADVEMHDYRELYALYVKAKNDQSLKKAVAEDLARRVKQIESLLEDISDTLREDRDISDIEQAIDDTLLEFENVIKEQGQLVRHLIESLHAMKTTKKEHLLDGIQPSRSIRTRIASIEETLNELQTNMYDEKHKVFDVFNQFMKKKRTVETRFEMVMELTLSKDLLGISDISLLLATITTVDEAWDLLSSLKHYYNLFDKDAQNMIEEEEKRYKKMLKKRGKEARFAHIDPLTGVANARAYYLALRDAKAAHTEPLSMIALDIDFFKAFNEVYGHKAGDIVLRTVAKEMSRQLRHGTDILFRKGGEEFVILLRKTNLAGAKVIAEKIRRHIEQLDLPKFMVDNELHRKDFWKEGKLRLIKDRTIYAYNPETKNTMMLDRKHPSRSQILSQTSGIYGVQKGTEEQVWLTVSFGVASYPDHADDIEKLNDIADSAAIEAKTLGRNRVEVAQKAA